MLPRTENRNVYIILPAYNEHQTIGAVLETLLRHSYTVVVIDDGSEPSLLPIVKKYPVYYLRHSVNLGQGAALQTGIDFALQKDAGLLVTFDADAQHDVNDIGRLLQELSEGQFDIVMGSRFMQNASHNLTMTRKLVLKMARYVNFVFTGLLLTDAHNGIRAMTRRAAEKIRIEENRMSHATEILSQINRQKLDYKEVPVAVYYTAYSNKKGQSLWNSFRIFFDLILNKVFK
jgi:polyprenyl-phospho-N-acetylgalactosaminyl synthase